MAEWQLEPALAQGLGRTGVALVLASHPWAEGSSVPHLVFSVGHILLSGRRFPLMALGWGEVAVGQGHGKL